LVPANRTPQDFAKLDERSPLSAPETDLLLALEKGKDWQSKTKMGWGTAPMAG
jgi:hypothetical protein